MINIFFRNIIKHRKKVPFLPQSQITECGLTCVAMIIKYYMGNVSINQLRQIFETGRDGCTIKQLNQLLHKFNMETKLYKIPAENIKCIKLPCILFWENSHFVILERIKKDKFYIVDPAMGRNKISLEMFSKSYSGISIYPYPDEKFDKDVIENITYRVFSFIVVKNKYQYAKTIFYMLICSFCSIAIPIIIGKIIDIILISEKAKRLNILFFALIAVVIGLYIFSYLKNNSLLILKSQIMKDISLKIFPHIIKLPYKFFDHRNIRDIEVNLNNISLLKNIFSNDIMSFIKDILLLVFMLLYLYSLSWIFVGVFIILYLINLLITVIINNTYNHRELLFAELSLKNFQKTCLKSIIQIKSMGIEQEYIYNWKEKFNAYISKYLDIGKKNNLDLIVSLSQKISVFIVLYISSSFMIKDKITYGVILSNYLLAILFFSSVNSLYNSAKNWLYGKNLMNNLLDIISQQEESENLPCYNLIGNIVIKDLSFSYNSNSRYIFENINLNINAGDKIAIIGDTNSGKSTFLKLLAGLYLPTKGKILFDNHDLKDFNKIYLRKQIGIITEDTSLLNTTIYNNITLGLHKCDVNNVVNICKILKINEDISNMPLGYHTPILNNGNNLSVSQRRKILLARIIIKNPKIVLIDGSALFIDDSNKVDLFSMLDSIKCTKLIISSKINPITKADLIVMIDNGKIIAQGKHDELLINNKKYKTKYFSETNYIQNPN